LPVRRLLAVPAVAILVSTLAVYCASSSMGAAPPLPPPARSPRAVPSASRGPRARRSKSKENAARSAIHITAAASARGARRKLGASSYTLTRVSLTTATAAAPARAAGVIREEDVPVPTG
jgi:hypothetical protein